MEGQLPELAIQNKVSLTEKPKENKPIIIKAGNTTPVDYSKDPLKDGFYFDPTGNRLNILIEDLGQLDENDPAHRVLKKVLNRLTVKYRTIDENMDNLTKGNPMYERKAATLQDAYPETPLVEVLLKETIYDPYNIFLGIKELFKERGNRTSRDLFLDIIKMISNRAEVWVVVTKVPDEEKEEWIKLDKDRIILNKLRKGVNGTSNKVSIFPYDASEATNPRRSGDWQNTNEYVLIMNEEYINEDDLFASAVHELGHVVEKKFGAKQIVQGQAFETEAISTLYGIGAGMSVAEFDEDLAEKIIWDQVAVYNRVMHGTGARTKKTGN